MGIQFSVLSLAVNIKVHCPPFCSLTLVSVDSRLYCRCWTLPLLDFCRHWTWLLLDFCCCLLAIQSVTLELRAKGNTFMVSLSH